MLVLALGVAAGLVRAEPDSSVLRGYLVGNALVHAGLFPIEIHAYANGVIGRLDGIVPNSVLHVVVAGGFTYYAATMRTARADASLPAQTLAS